MRAEVARSALDQRAYVIGWLAAIAVGIFLVGPRASPATLVLLVMAALTAGGGMPRLNRALPVPPPIAMALALTLWATVSIAWAQDYRAVEKSALLAAFTLVAWLGLRALQDADTDRLVQLGRAVAISYAVCVVYLLFEQATDHAFKRALFTLLPFLRPAAKHIADTADGLQLSDYVSNRNMAAMTLLLWPVLLLSWLGLPARLRAPLASLLFLAIAVAAAMSAHETSIIAIAASAPLLLLAAVAPRAALAIAAAGWLSLTLLIVPLAGWSFHSAEFHKAGWLPNSARQRIVIWAYAASEVPKRPLTGIGMAAAKTLDARRGPKVEVVPGTPYQWRSSPHTHNVYLQTWYELGAIGAALLCAFGLFLLGAVSRLSPTARPPALAAFVAAMVTGAFSWGMWQAWFMAAFAVTALCIALAVEIDRRNYQRQLG
jgi:O-antigen ligase